MSMNAFTAKSQIKQQTLEAKVIRADGSVEDLGVIAFYHRNPLRRLAWGLSQLLRGKRPGVISHQAQD